MQCMNRNCPNPTTPNLVQLPSSIALANNNTYLVCLPCYKQLTGSGLPMPSGSSSTLGQTGRFLSSSQLQSMSSLSQMQMLQLQASMDRRSKIVQTLSNILKKQHDTASTIISNLR